ncbi:MAG: FAD-dependent oxidoreductase, partial [Chlorobiales bacterium]|nr:FAD-dependent oxidoreductase [Chlorobiales bacterium]
QLQRLQFTINNVIETEYAANVADLSLWYYDDQGQYLGPDVLFPNGYGAIPDYLAQGLDIRLEHICEEIDYSAESVRVLTNQGEFTAPRAVVTLPIGVLKSGQVRFTPGLPSAKQQAMDGLGFGVLNKVYLEFPAVFWDQTPHALGYVSEQKGRFNAWINFVPVNGQPILLGFNGGEFGLEIEDWSDEDIIALAMQTLRTIYGPNIPAPVNHLITRWSKDPFALGSYSSIMPGASSANYEIMAEALDERLYFAGEATHRTHPSTVHGAYLSGLRAAEEIIEAD